ncbi:antigen identified by monoclonal antibody Ki-67 [Linnemannia zychae]|nr:antigen identified by monoclonal antibody Ki-67 [Linnemannia zychae]
MSDTPKSPGRRQLRKSALQASPFGAPVKSFLRTTSGTASSTSAPTTPTNTRIKPGLPFMSSAALDLDPHEETESTTSPLDSPTSRKSARLSNMYKNMDPSIASKKPPTTPKSKTHLKIGVWGYVVGLKKQDLSEYCRFPIDKSYCSFGRSSSNDVPVPFESVSDMHCKLIRREDGEVWLKDTSTIGTLLNNVLVHETARPIEHNDIMTIAGRSFRFESVMTAPRQPLQVADGNITPKRHIRSIQSSIGNDISALAEVPSPTIGRISTTPKRNFSRSTAALESSLGLFTPNSAAKLSSLLVSPKPIPLPAFLKSPKKPSASPSKASNSNFALHTTDTHDDLDDNAGWHTPTKEKRKIPDDFFSDSGRTPKKVSFGPDLNPEIFSKDNPPNTPIKRGDHQQSNATTPSFMSRLAAAGGTPKSILTPSKSGRTSVLHGLEKPTPLKLRLFSPEIQKTVTPKKQAVSSYDDLLRNGRMSTSDKDKGIHDSEFRKKFDSSAASPFLVSSAEREITKEGDKDRGEDDEDDDESPPSTPTRKPAFRISNSGFSTPNRPRDLLASKVIEPEEHLHHSFKLQASSQTESDNPFISNSGDSPSHSPTIEVVQRHHPEIADALQEELETSLVTEPESPSITESETFNLDNDVLDTTPVHTPVRNRHKDDQKSDMTPLKGTPGSASRFALLQLSAQKIRGLPDLLQSPSSTSLFRESSETTSATKTDNDKVEPSQDINNISKDYNKDETETTTEISKSSDNEKADEVTQTTPEAESDTVNYQEDDQGGEESRISESAIDNEESLAVDQDKSVIEEEESSSIPTKNDRKPLTWTSNNTDSKRRSSAPAAATILHPQSPIFNGLRGVFRTPQKVVETCFAGLSGFRNFVLTPTRAPKQPSVGGSTSQDAERNENPFQVKSENSNMDEVAVETLDVQEITTANGCPKHGPELAEFTFTAGIVSNKTADIADHNSNINRFSADDKDLDNRIAMTPQRRISSHQDALELLTGHSGEPSPKSREFTFATNSLEKIKSRGRRSDIFPQKRTVAKRSYSQSREKDGDINEPKDIKDGSSRRRRTISMFEFMSTASTSIGSVTETLRTEDRQNEHQNEDDSDDAEQAELLRLLGEGADSGDDDDENSAQEEDIAAIEEPSLEDVPKDDNDALDNENSEESPKETIKDSPRRRSLSLRSNIHQSKYAPHNKRKLAPGEEAPVSMKEKVSKEIELAKLRGQVTIDKPKKTIKKKPMSTKAKMRREKTLERGLMNAEKDEKRIDKHLEKVNLKKRGKQMWE